MTAIMKRASGNLSEAARGRRAWIGPTPSPCPQGALDAGRATRVRIQDATSCAATPAGLRDAYACVVARRIAWSAGCIPWASGEATMNPTHTSSLHRIGKYASALAVGALLVLAPTAARADDAANDPMNVGPKSGSITCDLRPVAVGAIKTPPAMDLELTGLQARRRRPRLAHLVPRRVRRRGARDEPGGRRQRTHHGGDVPGRDPRRVVRLRAVDRPDEHQRRRGALDAGPVHPLGGPFVRARNRSTRAQPQASPSSSTAGTRGSATSSSSASA